MQHLHEYSLADTLALKHVNGKGVESFMKPIMCKQRNTSKEIQSTPVEKTNQTKTLFGSTTALQKKLMGAKYD